MIGRTLCVGLFAMCALAATAARAEEARVVAWTDLVVKVPEADNPFASLTSEQLLALGDVAGIRARKARGITLSAEEEAIERHAVERLRKDRIDPDELLAKRDAVAAKLRAAQNAANPALDGKLIRIPGYMLPLEFSGSKVAEFLLVPWVGACIHTPPPEANQIVYVKPDKAYEMRQMFDAVWVTGRLAAAGSRRSVHIVDGAADVDVGYALRASAVEPYRD